MKDMPRVTFKIQCGLCLHWNFFVLQQPLPIRGICIPYRPISKFSYLKYQNNFTNGQGLIIHIAHSLGHFLKLEYYSCSFVQSCAACSPLFHLWEQQCTNDLSGVQHDETFHHQTSAGPCFLFQHVLFYKRCQLAHSWNSRQVSETVKDIILKISM